MNFAVVSGAFRRRVFLSATQVGIFSEFVSQRMSHYGCQLYKFRSFTMVYFLTNK